MLIRILAVGVATLALGAPPALAAPRFATPEVLAGGAVFTNGTHRSPTAINAKGESAVAWTTGGGGIVAVRRGDASGHFGAPATAGQVGALAGFPSPQATIGPTGTTVALWQSADGAEVAAAPWGKPFGPTQLIAPNTGFTSYIVAAGNRFVAVWANGRTSLQYAIAGPGGRFGAPRTLSSTATGLMDLAAAPDGDAVVLVSHQTGSSLHQAASLSAGATAFTPLRPIGAATAHALASGPGGIAAFPGKRVAFYRSPVFSPSVPVTLKPVSPLGGDSAFDAFGTEGLALPARGGAVAAYTIVHQSNSAVSPTTGELEAVTRARNGAFSKTTEIAKPGTVAQFVAATATDDTAIIAWAQGRNDDQQIRYVLRSARGGFSPPRTLATHADGFALHATGAGRHAIISWETDRGFQLHVSVLQGD